MRFVVCLRSTVDPVSSPALRSAASLRCREDEVIVVSMGTTKAVPMLQAALSHGANAAFLLSDPAFAGADTHATSRALQAFIGKFVEGQFMVLTQPSDAQAPTGVVPARLAGLLGVEQFYFVTSVSRDDSGVTCVQDYGDEVRRCSVPDGSVLCVETSDFDLPETSPDAQVVTLNRVDLGLGLYSCGKEGSRTAFFNKGAS